MSSVKPRPRRRKRSGTARLRPFWIVGLLTAVAAGYGLYRAAVWPGFFPRTVTVTGNRIVPTAEILQRARIRTDENLWLQNRGAAQARIEAIPDIATAAIHRSLPARVTIAVTERLPYAVVKTSRGSAVVDEHLRVLAPVTTTAGLPVWAAGTLDRPLAPGRFLTGTRAAELRNDYALLRRAHVPVQALSFDAYGDLVAQSGGVRLLLGDDTDLAKKTPLIDPILSQAASGGKRIAAVDLRAPGAPVVTYGKK